MEPNNNVALVGNSDYDRLMHMLKTATTYVPYSARRNTRTGERTIYIKAYDDLFTVDIVFEFDKDGKIIEIADEI